MNAWDQFVLLLGYIFLGESAVFIAGGLLVALRENRSCRKKQQEITALERMYEGH